MSSSRTRHSEEHRRILLDVARQSIGVGLLEGRPLSVDPSHYAPELRVSRSTFVTLRRQGNLRGCVGGLEERQPLVADVAESAFKAAFHDPRFSPLTQAEFEDLEISVSILGPRERLDVRSEEELLASLRPGRDGLVLQEGARRATFLPAVWESLPNARDFVGELKLKAGLPRDHWSPQLTAWRYAVESIP